MAAVLATAGLLILALIVTSCLWPPKASRVTSLVMALVAIALFSAVVVALAVILIVCAIGAALLIASGLPVPEWFKQIVNSGREWLMKAVRNDTGGQPNAVRDRDGAADRVGTAGTEAVQADRQ
jgi:hypothetical protein